MDMLIRLLREDIERRQWSDRQMARNIGLSATTIGRFLAGESVDLETILVICKWLKVNPSEAIDSLMTDQRDGYLNQLALLLDTDAMTKDLLVRLLTLIDNGEMPLSALREALQYVMIRHSMELQAKD